jgi:hypothetical protein
MMTRKKVAKKELPPSKQASTAKVPAKTKAFLKGISKPAPPLESSPLLTERTPSPDPLPLKLALQAPVPFTVGLSVKVTVDKEHFYSTGYEIDFNAEYCPGYIAILLDVQRELNLNRYSKPLLEPEKWSAVYGPLRERQSFDIRTNRGSSDWVRFEKMLKISHNKSAEILIEYGVEWPPGKAPIPETMKVKVKKELVLKRPFDDQFLNIDDLPDTPSTFFSESKKLRVTSTSQLLDSHHSQVRAQVGTIFDYQHRIHNKWLCKIPNCNENHPCWNTLESEPHNKLSGADTKLWAEK